MQRLFGLNAGPRDRPLMHQGLSHRFLAPGEDVCLPSEDHDTDFEGEFAIVADEAPMRISPDDVLARIRLVLLVNDWSLAPSS